MEILLGLLIIAIGSFGQSSCYVPINKIKKWSWESYWIVQGVFAWLILPLLGALLAVPAGHSLFELFSSDNSFNIWMTIFFGVLWGVGGLTFGLSMRYLGVALGQSIALGTCAGLGTIMAPVLLNMFFPELDALSKLYRVGYRWSRNHPDRYRHYRYRGLDEVGLALRRGEKAAVKDFNFPKGITIALLAGFMSGCFNVGLEFGKGISFPETAEMFRTLPATFLVTLGGFVTNAIYCFYQNQKNKTWDDYKKTDVWANNALFCLLAGALWYSQFFGLSIGKGFLTSSEALTTLSFCILMALNVVFSNVWGIILKEWKGCNSKTISVLVIGLIVLVFAAFAEPLLNKVFGN